MNQSQPKTPSVSVMKLIFTGIIFSNFVYLLLAYFVDLKNDLKEPFLSLFENSFLFSFLLLAFLVFLFLFVGGVNYYLKIKMKKDKNINPFVKSFLKVVLYNSIAIWGLLIAFIFGFQNILILYFVLPPIVMYKLMPDFDKLKQEMDN